MGSSTSSLAGEHVTKNMSCEGGGIRSEQKVFAEEKGGTEKSRSTSRPILNTPGRVSSIVSIDSKIIKKHYEDQEYYDDDDIYEIVQGIDSDSSDEDSVCEEFDYDERRRILDEVAALKKLATDYYHPEAGVTSVDGKCFARNYFNRPSAPEVYDNAEGKLILAEARALKILATDYYHPEECIKSVDPMCFGRITYSSSSHSSADDSNERFQILADATALKELASYFCHPEHGIKSEDSSCLGRNYFNRASADTKVDYEERALVLQEAASLKKLAIDYFHPEKGIDSVDSCAFGRNYFTRPSGPDNCDVVECEQILVDAAALKKSAAAYAHPEVKVEIDSTCFGRNYFDRSSIDHEDVNEDECAAVLADTLALKKLATDYYHPEVGVESVDSTSFGRNYFNRTSEDEEKLDDEERAMILKEAASLKKLASDYLHPEDGIKSVDSCAFGRNYFTRPSGLDNCDVECEQILADAAALKKSAAEYAHPEVKVEIDSTCFGRNYFSRPSSTMDKDIVVTNHTSVEPVGSVSEDYGHFGFDEDFVQDEYYADLKDALFEVVDNKKVHAEKGKEEESNLSRSPSSVLLFDDGIY